MPSYSASRAANSVFSEKSIGSGYFQHDNGLFYRTFLALLRAQDGEADLTALARQAVDKTNFETRILRAAQAGDGRLAPDDGAGQIAAFMAQVWSLDMPGSAPLAFQDVPEVAASPDAACAMPAENAAPPDEQVMAFGTDYGPDEMILTAGSLAEAEGPEPVTAHEEARFEPSSMDVLMMVFGDMQRQTGTYADTVFGEGGTNPDDMLDIRQSA